MGKLESVVIDWKFVNKTEKKNKLMDFIDQFPKLS